MLSITKEQAKKTIKETIESAGACKAITLIMELMNYNEFRKHEYRELSNLIDELVRDKEITEIEYVTPNMPNRIKSIYFPKGTEIKVL